MRRARLIVAGAIFAGFFATSGSSEERDSPAVRVVNSPPLVSFDVFEPAADGELTMPPLTPPLSPFLDEHGVYATRVGEDVAWHIAVISREASGLVNFDIDTDAALRREKSITEPEKAALDWLRGNQIAIANKAITWHYTFNHAFNNIVAKAGWPSAFAQADVIKAFLLAYRKTSDQSYLELATRAGYAYTVPGEAGGLRCEVGGIPWFEELPLPYGYAPMILNGHLYSVVMLHRLYEVTHDKRIGKAFDEGAASAKRLLLSYDTGYWTIYQLRPRILNVLLVLDPHNENIEIHEVSVSSPVIRPSVLRLSKDAISTYRGNEVRGNGWGPAADWGRQLIAQSAININPGQPGIDNDPVNAGTMTVSMTYRSSGCTPPIVATFDYRARSKGFAKIFASSNVTSGDACVVSYALPTTINQWSTLDAFYQKWHTKLVTELWRITRDPKFYAAAVRWGRYATAEEKLKPDETKDAIFTQVFQRTESSEEDTDIMRALNGVDPATLADEDVAKALRAWIQSHCVPLPQARELMARAGLAAPDGQSGADCSDLGSSALSRH